MLVQSGRRSAACSTSLEYPAVSHTIGTTQGMVVFVLLCVLAGTQVLISRGSMIHKLYSTCSSYAMRDAITEYCTYPLVHGLVEHPNQERYLCNCARTGGGASTENDGMGGFTYPPLFFT